VSDARFSKVSAIYSNNIQDDGFKN